MAQRSGRDDEQVFSITTASTSHSDEVDARMKRYMVSMGVRTACFVGAIVTDGWVRWVLIAGAVLLPYFAVIIASSGVRRRPDVSDMNTNVAVAEIEPGRT